MKNKTILLLGLLLSASVFAAPPLQKPKEPVVTVLQIVEHPELDKTRQGIIDILKSKDISIRFQSAQGNPLLATQIAEHFVGIRPNVMVSLGTTATQALIAADNAYKIPVVFSSVSDPISARLVNHLKHPEGFVTGVSNFIEPRLCFQLFKKILPSLSRLGVIYNPGEANSVALLQKMQAVASEFGLTLVLGTVHSSAEVPQVAQSLVKKAQAIFINNDNTALSAFDAISRISTQHKIPVFSSSLEMIDHGALATIGPNQYRIGEQTGEIILRILNGTPLQEISVQFPDKMDVEINEKQAKILDIAIPNIARLKEGLTQ